ncbi:MAG TPA: hypothetical protein V6C72_10205 [Chroococcales cyanobacterium]
MSPSFAKSWPHIGHSEERHCEDRKFKQKHHQYAGVAICPRCNAIWRAKHWYVKPSEAQQLAADPLTRSEYCPGCDQINKEIYEGEVHLIGTLHDKDSALGLLNHTEAKAYLQNPRSRIARIDTADGALKVLTTTAWLATRIGKEFEKAFKGSLEIKRSPGERFVIVNWQAP